MASLPAKELRSEARQRAMIEAQRLLHCMDNEFECIDALARPTEAKTFSLRTWAAARRLLQQRQQAEDAARGPEQELCSDPWAPPIPQQSMEASKRDDTSSSRKAPGTPTPAVAQPEVKKPPSYATVAASGMLAQWDEAPDDDDEATHSHLRQESSAIMAGRRKPKMRHNRVAIARESLVAAKHDARIAVLVSQLDPDIGVADSGTETPVAGNGPLSAFASPAIQLQEPSGVFGPGPTTAVGNRVPQRDAKHASFSATAEEKPVSMMEALRRYQRQQGQDRLPVDWHRSASNWNDSLEQSRAKARSASANASPTFGRGHSSMFLEPVPSTISAASGPFAHSYASPSGVVGDDARAAKPSATVQRTTFRTADDPATVVTNHSERLRGPMALLHPIRGVDRINYDELYRDQFTAARDLLDRDLSYMALIDNLDYHMASVKFTFNAMLDGKFMHDESAKRAELDKRRRVLGRENRVTTISDDSLPTSAPSPSRAAAGAATTTGGNSVASNTSMLNPLQGLARSTAKTRSGGHVSL
jgi:hypothetical protein